MATRRNVFTKIGRPARVPKAPSTPTEGLSRAIPAAAFSHGGTVGGYKPMPGHHDCPAMMNLKRKDC